jgi:hypothetical protein
LFFDVCREDEAVMMLLAEGNLSIDADGVIRTHAARTRWALDGSNPRSTHVKKIKGASGSNANR